MEAAMPRDSEPKNAELPKRESDCRHSETRELSSPELDEVSGGTKLPGKKKPPTLTLK